MSDSDNNPLNSLLSSFALGPAWARVSDDKSDRKPKAYAGGEDRPPRRDDRERGSRAAEGSRDRDGGDRRRPPQGRGNHYSDRQNSPPPQLEAPPAVGVSVSVTPDPKAIHLIGKEVHQVARVYPLFDVAKIILAEKSRCRAIFEAVASSPPLIVGKLEETVFLTREEACRHLWNSDLRNDLIEEETIDVDPPTGNFQAIARCGVSGEWLGPVNYHSYQTNLRRLHRERFARMPFEIYSSKVRTERGDEAVNAWLETMKTMIRWRIKGEDDEAWINDRNEAELALGSRCFDKAFAEVRVANVSGAISPKNLSPSLLTSLKIAGTHARNHPATLIPAVCRAVEAEHLPVFKRHGKLHTGPARPHPLALDAMLAERPAIMVGWIRENPPAKLEGLWKAVLPEGSTAPPAEFAADLFWLLHQGHILLFTDDTLVVQDARQAAADEVTPAVKKAKKKKKKTKKPNLTEASNGASSEGGKTETTLTTTAIVSSTETDPKDTAKAPLETSTKIPEEVSEVQTERLSDPVNTAVSASVDVAESVVCDSVTPPPASEATTQVADESDPI